MDAAAIGRKLELNGANSQFFEEDFDEEGEPRVHNLLLPLNQPKRQTIQAKGGSHLQCRSP